MNALWPVMVQLVHCRNVLIDGGTFTNSPSFHLQPVQCEDVVIRNISVTAEWFAQNGDGIDISSCRRVVVYDCLVNVGDDAICLKPGKLSPPAGDGSGDFLTSKAALDAVPDGNGNNVTIFIEAGTYAEKVYITKSHVTLLGESRDSTRILFAELRENWTRDHGGSDRGAGVVNIDTGVSDVTIANLTVHNNYGTLHGTTKHQFAIRGAARVWCFTTK